jgi:hypothetical protein
MTSTLPDSTTKPAKPDSFIKVVEEDGYLKQQYLTKEEVQADLVLPKIEVIDGGYL